MAIVRLAYRLNAGVNILDTAMDLSITQRRMIHQKQVFTVMGGMLVDDAAGTKIKISTAPNNFYTRNAVTRGFRAWKKMRAKAMENVEGSPIAKAKYSDFKIWLDESSTITRSSDAGSNQHALREWTRSDITAEAGAVTREFQIVGPHTASRYSLAKGWLETRPKPSTGASSPQMPDLNSDGVDDVRVDFLATLFDDTNESSERLADVLDENDNPPFEYDELITTAQPYSASEPNNLQLQCIVHNSQNDVANAVPGFQALCGLIRVDVTGGTNPILLIDVETKGWNF